MVESSMMLCESLGKMCSPATEDFVDGYENPIAWHKRHKVSGDQLNDVLFDNLDMKSITEDQYRQERTEYVKWKL